MSKPTQTGRPPLRRLSEARRRATLLRAGHEVSTKGVHRRRRGVWALKVVGKRPGSLHRRAVRTGSENGHARDRPHRRSELEPLHRAADKRLGAPVIRNAAHGAVARVRLRIRVAVPARLQDRAQPLPGDAVEALLRRSGLPWTFLDGACPWAGQGGEGRGDRERRLPAVPHASAVASAPRFRSGEEVSVPALFVSIWEKQEAAAVASLPLENKHQKECNEGDARNAADHPSNDGALGGGGQAGAVCRSGRRDGCGASGNAGRYAVGTDIAPGSACGLGRHVQEGSEQRRAAGRLELCGSSGRVEKETRAVAIVGCGGRWLAGSMTGIWQGSLTRVGDSRRQEGESGGGRGSGRQGVGAGGDRVRGGRSRRPQRVDGGRGEDAIDDVVQ